MELKDWLNSINQTKKNLIDEDSSLEKDYSPLKHGKLIKSKLFR